MEQRFQKFRESRQAAVRLSIAGEDYLEPDLPEEYREAYTAYLKQRLIPAAEMFVRNEDTERLEGLWCLQNFSAAMLEQLLSLSAREHRNASYVWLLQKKQESFGFSPRDFSL